MSDDTRNSLSRIEREYIFFLYDNARRSSVKTVTISQIKEFIQTPEGKRGFNSFKSMIASNSMPTETQPRKIGEFL